MKFELIYLSSIFIIGLEGKKIVYPSAESNNTQYPDHCQVPDGADGYRYYPKGKFQVKGKCIKVSCDDSFMFEEEQCKIPTFDIASLHCHLTEYDYEESFPDCCPKIMCKNKNGDETEIPIKEMTRFWNNPSSYKKKKKKERKFYRFYGITAYPSQLHKFKKIKIKRKKSFDEDDDKDVKILIKRLHKKHSKKHRHSHRKKYRLLRVDDDFLASKVRHHRRHWSKLSRRRRHKVYKKHKVKKFSAVDKLVADNSLKLLSKHKPNLKKYKLKEKSQDKLSVKKKNDKKSKVDKKSETPGKLKKSEKQVKAIKSQKPKVKKSETKEKIKKPVKKEKRNVKAKKPVLKDKQKKKLSNAKPTKAKSSTKSKKAKPKKAAA